MFDNTGCHDLVRVTDVAETLLVVNPPPRMCAYAEGAAIAQAEVRTYRVDPARASCSGATRPRDPRCRSSTASRACRCSRWMARGGCESRCR